MNDAHDAPVRISATPTYGYETPRKPVEQSAEDAMVERALRAYEGHEPGPSLRGMQAALSAAIPGVDLPTLARLAPEIARLAAGEAVCVPYETVEFAADWHSMKETEADAWGEGLDEAVAYHEKHRKALREVFAARPAAGERR